MKIDNNYWKKYWNSKSSENTPDYELDRGTSTRNKKMEYYSNTELINFLDPKKSDYMFDAGCGTGKNIIYFRDKVKYILGMDYSKVMGFRCKQNIENNLIQNANLLIGSITNIPIQANMFNKIICMSVLQYLNDDEFEKALTEMVRVAKNKAIIVFHVKNLSSIYLSTMYLAKRIKKLLKYNVKIEYYRTFRWYKKIFLQHGIDIVNFNSNNKFNFDLLPEFILNKLQKLELICYKNNIFKNIGADLKIKGIINK